MSGYHILMQFDIDSDRRTLHRALTTQAGIRSWWSERTTGPNGDDDGRLEVSFPDVPQPFEFDVVRTDEERVEWRTASFPPWWQGTTIRWDLADNPEGPGIRLMFSHRDFAPDNPVIPIVTPAWAQIILRLKGYAETGTPNPYFPFDDAE